MYAAETEFASQISISEQQEPWSPTPALGSLLDGFQPATLAWGLSATNLRGIMAETHLAVDKLEITGALSIAVSST